ncbi:MAG: peptide deformylase [Coprobacter sp.]|nr:peptide deformylase [Coprobacter sp.]
MKTRHALWGVFVLLTLCSARPHTSYFNRKERALIGGAGDSLMRVWQTTDRRDSLFLRTLSRPLSRKEIRSPYFETLKRRMLCTVRDTAHPGVGIAAPQVGIGRCLIAVQRFDKPGKPFEFYINPRLVYRSGQQQTGREGCLSVPDRAGSVSRSADIVVRYLDEATLQERQDTVSGYTAVIFQHETDHLEGILYIDKLEK